MEQEDKKLKPAYPDLYTATVGEFRAEVGMTYKDVQEGIRSLYCDYVRRYMGEDAAPYTDGADAEAVAKFFEKKWQNPYNQTNKH